MSQVTVRATATTFTATFVKLDSVTFNQQGNTTTVSNSSSVAVSSANNILAYRPNYRNNLATILIHMEAVYPCATSSNQISCKLLPREDDDFRGGEAILEAMDDGNLRVFSGTTYAFALQRCSQISTTCGYNSAYNYVFNLMCLVPSSVCSDTE